MNAERLLVHYEQIADAPDAIARLRRFILNLAVRGKLVPQDANDESASELLKRIAKEKAITGSRETHKAELYNKEELGELPPTWLAVPLIALGSWAIGCGFPKNEQGLEIGPYFFLKVSDMNLPGNEKFVTTSNNFIDDDAAKRMRAKIHPPGTIIFPKIGGAIATNKRRILTKGSAIDNNCLGITFGSALNVEWAFLLLTTLDFTRYQAGTAVPALQQGVLERIPVGLPPLAEQHRIVVKVNELVGLCDRLEEKRAGREGVRDRLAAASLSRLNSPDPETFQADARFALDALPALTARPDQIRPLRQTILNLAVRGMLVEGTTAKAASVGEYRTLQNGYAFKSSWFSKSGVRLLRNANIGHDEIRWNDVVHLPEDRLSEFERFQLNEGDIVLTLDRPFIVTGTKVARITAADLPALLLQRVGRFVETSPGLDDDYLFLWINSPHFNDQIDPGRSNGVPHISSKQVEAAEIFVPPLAEQHRIVAKVDALMAHCDKLEASLTATAAIRRRLLDALLAEALAPPAERELKAAE
ncbi:restriction endonuclease subunit S [Mesorhizobium sp.]|uniref:restriction endonuclease subunit S n=1 Tax=Mesorhizobium sp. TaxID=1871066 RepID=UPI000FEA2FE7|nr:restriction endonuclease subunit S [Mesorhizobium sp.]RWN25285.1 MAG: restriction endonuclease subunit S [Mesorhizobium sp.]